MKRWVFLLYFETLLLLNSAEIQEAEVDYDNINHTSDLIDNQGLVRNGTSTEMDIFRRSGRRDGYQMWKAFSELTKIRNALPIFSNRLTSINGEVRNLSSAYIAFESDIMEIKIMLRRTWTNISEARTDLDLINRKLSSLYNKIQNFSDRRYKIDRMIYKTGDEVVSLKENVVQSKKFAREMFRILIDKLNEIGWRLETGLATIYTGIKNITATNDLVTENEIMLKNTKMISKYLLQISKNITNITNFSTALDTQSRLIKIVHYEIGNMTDDIKKGHRKLEEISSSLKIVSKYVHLIMEADGGSPKKNAKFVPDKIGQMDKKVTNIGQMAYYLGDINGTIYGIKDQLESIKRNIGAKCGSTRDSQTINGLGISGANRTLRPESAKNYEKCRCNVCLKTCLPANVVSTFGDVKKIIFDEVDKLVWVVQFLGRVMMQVAYALIQQAIRLDIPISSNKKSPGKPPGSFTEWVKEENPLELPERPTSGSSNDSMPDSLIKELEGYLSIPFMSKNHSVLNSGKMGNNKTLPINETTETNEISDVSLRTLSSNETKRNDHPKKKKKKRKKKKKKKKKKTNKGSEGFMNPLMDPFELQKLIQMHVNKQLQAVLPGFPYHTGKRRPGKPRVPVEHANRIDPQFFNLSGLLNSTFQMPDLQSALEKYNASTYSKTYTDDKGNTWNVNINNKNEATSPSILEDDAEDEHESGKTEETEKSQKTEQVENDKKNGRRNGDDEEEEEETDEEEEKDEEEDEEEEKNEENGDEEEAENEEKEEETKEETEEEEEEEEKESDDDTNESADH